MKFSFKIFENPDAEKKKNKYHAASSQGLGRPICAFADSNECSLRTARGFLHRERCIPRIAAAQFLALPGSSWGSVHIRFRQAGAERLIGKLGFDLFHP
jgi:hypothetical protein